MAALDAFIDDRLAAGRGWFARDEAVASGIALSALAPALTRAVAKGKLAHPRHGFYLIVRPEHRAAGAADPAEWIDPLMQHQGLPYRVSLLRAAAHHGSSHQAAMIFQVVAPRQLRDLTLGAHRLQFIYQEAEAFAACNEPALLDAIKTPASFAAAAGVELTLLDCVRYMHRSGGLNSVAQIAKDLGGKADARKLAKVAIHYEGAAVRRLGYVLEQAGHDKAARALRSFAETARHFAQLDPNVKPLIPALAETARREPTWKLELNEAIEVDA
ncbi:MAG: type IV toxin-antitoxin system AbiEi family antitoxin domain-containing protein [Burkholderiaceae bacterium]|nr:type IV toxin-antitoxin system AbiEi family antitoxin domain-containing protein [Burkholderiaceae bacterium]